MSLYGHRKHDHVGRPDEKYNIGFVKHANDISKVYNRTKLLAKPSNIAVVAQCTENYNRYTAAKQYALVQNLIDRDSDK